MKDFEKKSPLAIAIYSFDNLEEFADELLKILIYVQQWCGIPFSEFAFSYRGKISRRIYKTNPKNLLKLEEVLKGTKSWSVIGFGWPEKALSHATVQTKSIELLFVSQEKPSREFERFRIPSYISLKIHPDFLIDQEGGIQGLLDLGVKIWTSINGVYGFIDQSVNTPLDPDFMVSSLEEFRNWQYLLPALDKKIPKVFWANYLGRNHILEIGKNKLTNPDSISIDELFQSGYSLLVNSGFLQGWKSLSGDGLLVYLSSGPSDQILKSTSERKLNILKVLNPLIS